MRLGRARRGGGRGLRVTISDREAICPEAYAVESKLPRAGAREAISSIADLAKAESTPPTGQHKIPRGAAGCAGDHHHRPGAHDVEARRAQGQPAQRGGLARAGTREGSLLSIVFGRPEVMNTPWS